VAEQLADMSLIISTRARGDFNSVEACQSREVDRRLCWRDPSNEDDAARARDRHSISVRDGLGRVAHEPTVITVLPDEWVDLSVIVMVPTRAWDHAGSRLSHAPTT
jgi:hypothetical protein